MKSCFAHILRYIVIFIAVFLLLLFFLIGAAMVPREKIRPKMLESAEYMCEHNTQYLVIDWILASRIDHYADCISLSIAYELDEKNPLRSSMYTSFYGYQTASMNQLLLDSVRNNLPASTEYLRYWHGSAAAMRYLHLFWNVKTIYVFHAILLVLLGLIVIYLLTKHGHRGEAVFFLLSMLIVSAWFVPLCLEYTYCFLCMLGASIAGVLMALHDKDTWISPLFLFTGMATVYFDFLTCETLSLLVPMLLIYRIQRCKNSEAFLWINAIRNTVLWGIGYLGMWIMKWVAAAAILRIDVIPYISGHIDERLNSAVSGYGTTGNVIYDAIALNLKKLIPYEYGIYGAIALLVILIIVFFVPVIKGKLVLRKNIQVSDLAFYAAVGLIPYIRYLVLRNHSIVHSFFTYRAQATTVLAIGFIILELVEPVRRKVEIDCEKYI